MKNTPDSPDIQEQEPAKPARSRTRSKPENATPVSQESESKPATPRRSSTSTRSHAQAEKSDTATKATGEEKRAEAPTMESAPRASAPRTESAPRQSASTERSEGASRRSETPRPPASTERSEGVPATPREGGQRQGPPSGPREGGPRQGSYSGPREGGQRQGPSSGPREGGQRQGSYSGPREGGPRQGSYSGPREGGQRQGPPSGPQSGPRQGSYAGPQGGGPRPAGGAPYAPRTGGGSGGPRPAGGGNAPYAPRQGGGPRPGGGPGQRSGGPRPAGQHGGGRPGGQHGGGRGPSRSGPPQRTHERRVAAVKEKPTGPISIPPQIVVKDLADLLQTTVNEIIRNLIKHSIFANINEVVDYEKAALVAQDLGFEPSQSEVTIAPAVQRRREGLASEVLLDAKYDNHLVTIPPVVTIMGHVDHGKTTLLDTIRKTKVAAGEAGGITQHIGAYQVEINNQKITFLDTPGHEAFTAMRARGAQVADIAIIVVAADDGVMPQTREAIDHAQAAKMPIIIALNKIDKAEANADHVKQQLAEIGVVVEEYGGDVVCVPVSARKGLGIDELLEMILLVAEVQDIKANPNRPATGVIIEARLEKSSGATATVLVQQGTLTMGDNVVVGTISGKIRAMINDRGKRVMKAPPSTPVSILGLPEVPQAGDRLEVMADEKTARQIAQKVAEQRRSESMPLGQVSLDTLYMQMQEGKVKELNVILKCDVQGSAEALKTALNKISDENLKVRLIREGIGNISETDVHLASASGAIIIGFNVTADGAAQRLAVNEGVDIRYYNIIYKLIDDIQAALTGMLEPTFREVVEGHAEVQQIFKAGKTTVIAGCRILDGKLTRASQARLLRKQAKVYEGKVASLRRGKDDVREVTSGYECGILLEDFTDFEVGDVIEAFTQEKVKPGA
ncbi:MAG TPA: translation initiation factor IF-2 [Ktedonobacteraceae bacterium]